MSGPGLNESHRSSPLRLVLRCTRAINYETIRSHGSLLPFTVTRSVTSRELSIAVESRDVNLVFGKACQTSLRKKTEGTPAKLVFREQLSQIGPRWTGE